MEDFVPYRTGIIECGDKNLVFFGEDYTFYFMVPLFEPFGSKREYSLKANENGFLYGTTHDNHSIAIYIGDFDREIYGKQAIKTNLFLVEPGNFNPYPRKRNVKYDAIDFVGKKLSRVFMPHALTFIREVGKPQRIEYHSDAETYHFTSGKISYTLTVQSLTPTSIGIKGSSVTNEDVRIRLAFNQPQTGADLIKHIENIRILLSFMTFRTVVEFDKVALLEKDESHPDGYCKMWDVFLKQPLDDSRKNNMKCITFFDLGTATENLLETIYSSVERRPSYSLGFIPESDSDVSHFDNDTIRAVCAGLECEIACSCLQNDEESKQIKLLAEEVKSFVSKRRKASYPLITDDNYLRIKGELKHWGKTATNNVIALYHSHEKAMQIVCGKIQQNITDEDIHELIKYRNDITHGSYRVNNVRMANTAYVLECLVYCCLLSRIGVEESKIEELCRMKIGS